MRFLSIALLLAFTGGATGQSPSTGSPQPAVLHATFIGNEAWHITDGEYVLLTDFPYEGGYSGYMTWDWADVPKAEGSKVLIAITHQHRDHFLGNQFPRLNAGGLIGPATVRTAAGKTGIEPGPDVRFGPIRVQAIPTPHAGLEHYSYIFEWQGVRFYLPGDTEETKSLVDARQLDVAFITPWQLGKSRRESARIDARRVIVVHHESGEAVPSYAGSIVPRQGDRYEFSRAANP